MTEEREWLFGAGHYLRAKFKFTFSPVSIACQVLLLKQLIPTQSKLESLLISQLLKVETTTSVVSAAVPPVSHQLAG